MAGEDPGSDLGITPATRVGKVRVAQKRRESGDKPLSREELMDQATEYNSELVVQPKHDFATPEELHFHDRTISHVQHKKPLPQVKKPTTHVQPHINQPGKN